MKLPHVFIQNQVQTILGDNIYKAGGIAVNYLIILIMFDQRFIHHLFTIKTSRTTNIALNTYNFYS